MVEGGRVLDGAGLRECNYVLILRMHNILYIILYTVINILVAIKLKHSASGVVGVYISFSQEDL